MGKKSLNILMIAHATNKAGGGEDDFFRLLKEFKNEFIIYGVIPEGYRAEQFEKYTDYPIRIPDKIFPFTKFNILKYIQYFLISLKKIKILYPFFRNHKNDFDICFVNSSVCLTEIMLLNHFKIPYVLSIKEKIQPEFIRKLIYKYYDRTAKAVIVISGELKKTYEEICKNIKPELIYSSIDEDEYTEIKNELNRNPSENNKDTFQIINIGNIYPLKNQIMLLDALGNKIAKQKIKVIFAGAVTDRQYFEKLKAKAEKFKGVEVIFAGAIDRKEVIRSIYNSDCVVITSKQEGMSLVLVESLFMEKPLIATPVGAIPDVIRNGINGFMLNGFDSSELSNYIDKLINDKDIAVCISKNAFKAYKENFDIGHYLKSHREILLNNAYKNERN